MRAAVESFVTAGSHLAKHHSATAAMQTCRTFTTASIQHFMVDSPEEKKTAKKIASPTQLLDAESERERESICEGAGIITMRVLFARTRGSRRV
jgi:hypothetical protein